MRTLAYGASGVDQRSGAGRLVVSSAVVTVSSRRRAGLLALVAAAVLVLPPTAAASPPRAASGQQVLEMTLSTAGDFVAQANFVQCVGASMQMMLNIVRPQDDRTARRQLELQQLARTLSPSRPDGRIRQGASVRGWADGLNQLGAGPYRLVGTATIEEAMRLATAAIRETRHPVGLLMWQGRHAWVMSGFRAVPDASVLGGLRVTHAVVLDPLYPHGSRTWGASPRPGTALTIDDLGRQFRPRRTGSFATAWLAGFGGQYVLVLPYTPTPAAHPARPVAT
jgi:hypothetical protein